MVLGFQVEGQQSDCSVTIIKLSEQLCMSPLTELVLFYTALGKEKLGLTESSSGLLFITLLPSLE